MWFFFKFEEIILIAGSEDFLFNNINIIAVLSFQKIFKLFFFGLKLTL